MACQSDEYCFTCICSLFAETGSSSFLFVSKAKHRMVAVVFRSNSTVTSSSSLTKVGCFVFVSFCFVDNFILPLEPFFYHLLPRSANYVPSFLGAQAREAIQKNDTGKQTETNKKALVRFELEASPSLSTYM